LVTNQIGVMQHRVYSGVCDNDFGFDYRHAQIYVRPVEILTADCRKVGIRLLATAFRMEHKFQEYKALLNLRNEVSAVKAFTASYIGDPST
jgi:hypothetical protein